ncbi:MAG: RHS repeat domain-containing protein, partial [Myxococcaceae bacterium]
MTGPSGQVTSLTGHAIYDDDAIKTFDVLGRPKSDVLVESISANGQELPTKSVTYVDTPGASGLTEVQETDADGHTTKRKADALHRELQVEDALRHASYSWFDAINRRVSQDRKGYRTEYDYDGVGRLLAQRDFELQGASARYTQSTTYDDALRKVTAKDRRFGSTGTTLAKELDGLGRVVKTTRGAQTETTDYDGNGNPALVTDANGHQTKSVFDGANRLVEQTKGAGKPEAATTRFKYDAAGNRLEAKSQRATGMGYDSRDSYDELNRPVRTEDANGSVTTRAYDEAGNLLCEKRPLGRALIPHGPVTGLTVDALKSIVCTPGFLTQFAYEEEGKLRSVTDAQGALTSYTYDETRDLVAKQDAKGHLTTYGYDELHRRTAEHQHLSEQSVRFGRGTGALPAATAPDTAFTSGALSWRRGYDDNGNVAWATDPKGQRADYVYGLLDRLGSVAYSGQAAPRPALSLNSEGYGYDENGNLTGVQLSKLGAATEYTTRTFDVLDRLETETRYDGKLTRYGYDKKGNRTRVTDSENVATVYTFDALDRLKTATLPAGTASYEYWEDSLPKAITLPNGVVEKKCYDAGGRLASQVTSRGAISDTCQPTGPALSRYDYTYDANGNRLTQVEQRTDVATQGLGLGESTQYGYDELDRLVGVKYPDGTAHLYQLDEVGNRTGERRGPSSLVSALTVAAFLAMPPAQATHDIQSVFNGADWLVTQTDSRDASRSVALEYDANGNLTSKVKATSVRSFQWDVRDTLASIQDDGLEVGRYDYDRSLQRTKRTTASENVEYVLDDKFVLQEADGSQASHPATRRYHYATNALAVTDGATTSFLSVDGQGSVTDATSTSGSLTSARQYDAWGRYRNNSGPTATEPKLGYTSHQSDVESGLVYAVGGRYYDPDIGRWLSRDSYEGELSDAPSLHRYGYVKNNPLKYVDPTGHAEEITPGLDTPTAHAMKMAAEEVAKETATRVGSTAVLGPPGAGAIILGVPAAVGVSAGEATLITTAALASGAAGGVATHYLVTKAELEARSAVTVKLRNACAAGNRNACGAEKWRNEHGLGVRAPIRESEVVERRDAPGAESMPKVAPAPAASTTEKIAPGPSAPGQLAPGLDREPQGAPAPVGRAGSMQASASIDKKVEILRNGGTVRVGTVEEARKIRLL